MSFSDQHSARSVADRNLRFATRIEILPPPAIFSFPAAEAEFKTIAAAYSKLCGGAEFRP